MPCAHPRWPEAAQTSLQTTSEAICEQQLGQRPAEPRPAVLCPQLPTAGLALDRALDRLPDSALCILLDKAQIKTSKALQPKGCQTPPPLESIITYGFISAFNYCLSYRDLILRDAGNGVPQWWGVLEEGWGRAHFCP